MLLWADVWPWVPPVLNVVLLLAGIFLILLILIQRGKGGGLAGAFGGSGGSSAFGSRAGDAFTRVTIMTAAVWILLIMVIIRTTQPAPAPDNREAIIPGAPAAPADQGGQGGAPAGQEAPPAPAGS
jgi:preprotein translocase subunit SecG